jgi:two-component system sensor histidine kinase DctS
VIPALDKAVDQAQRAGQVIRRIYSLARHSEHRVEQVDIAERIDAVLGLVDTDLRQKAVRISLAVADRALIEGDPVLIEQVLLNLLRNAVESMREAAADSRTITISLSCVDGYAQLKIADRGSGIDPSIAEKLFDPLFTTKPDGMGMGLAICRSVIENHRGRLVFEKNPEGGTVFCIMLPLASR